MTSFVGDFSRFVGEFSVGHSVGPIFKRTVFSSTVFLTDAPEGQPIIKRTATVPFLGGSMRRGGW